MTDPSRLAEAFRGCEWIDLTHTLEEGIPVWPTHARFGHTLYESYELGDVACQYGISIGEHTGTHMDSPLHFIASGAAHYGTDEMPLERLAGRAATVRADDLVEGDELTKERILDWEGENGEIEAGDVVLIRYGWDVRWGVGKEGRSFLAPWPGLAGDAAEYLAGKGVSIVGCDTLAVDATHNDDNRAHYALLGNETYIVENLKNLDRLPAFSFFMAFPLKIKGGSGSPVRAVALVSGEGS